MSNIGSIQFVAQNQTMPALEHAKNIAKELTTAEINPQNIDAPKVIELSEGAKTDTNLHDKEQEENLQKHKGNQHHSESNAKDDEQNPDSRNEESEQTTMFGQLIDLQEQELSQVHHLNLLV